MLPYQFVTLMVSFVGSVLGVGVVLTIFMMRVTGRLDTDRRATDARIEKYLAEAAADRRAIQASTDAFRGEMSTFRAEMHRLAERQARLEGTAAD